MPTWLLVVAAVAFLAWSWALIRALPKNLKELPQSRAMPVLLIGYVVLTGGAWYAYITFRPLDEAQLTQVSGTLKATYERAVSDKSPNKVYLELFINENPARFRVSQSDYEYFDSQAFFANVHAGGRLTLQVERAELEQAARATTERARTVSVYAVKDERMAYGTLEGHHKSESEDHFYNLVFACGATLVGTFVVYLVVRARRQKLAKAA